MSVARAVMVTWAALAAWPRYGGSENGAFWKRVISELLKKQRLQRAQPSRGSYWSPPRSLHKSVTDTLGFFDRQGHAFPRFMVMATSEQDSSFAGLLTSEDSALNASVRAVLKSVPARLSPFMCRAPPPIGICLQTCGAFVKRDSGALAALIRAVNGSKTDQPSSAFRICQIQLHGSVVLGGDENVVAIVDFFYHVPVPVRHVRLTPLRDGPSRPHTTRWINAVLRTRDHGAQVGSINFARDDMDDSVFQALASALPFATSIHSLRVEATSHAQHDRLEQSDLPWIAYAIFHPQAKRSSWHHLELQVPLLTERGANVMAAIARGNNLLALLNGSASESDAYYSAQLLKEDDHVRDALDEHAHLHLGALVPLASTLTFLDIGSYSNLATPMLRELLHACPMLKVLVVSHASELWSQSLINTPDSIVPGRLEELSF